MITLFILIAVIYLMLVLIPGITPEMFDSETYIFMTLLIIGDILLLKRGGHE